MWKTFRPGALSVEKYDVKENENELHNTDGCCQKGIITKELQAVAEKEQMDTAQLMQLVAEGKVAIPANKNHKCLDPNGIGSMLKTKIKCKSSEPPETVKIWIWSCRK